MHVRAGISLVVNLHAYITVYITKMAQKTLDWLAYSCTVLSNSVFFLQQLWTIMPKSATHHVTSHMTRILLMLSKHFAQYDQWRNNHTTNVDKVQGPQDIGGPDILCTRNL